MNWNLNVVFSFEKSLKSIDIWSFIFLTDINEETSFLPFLIMHAGYSGNTLAAMCFLYKRETSQELSFLSWYRDGHGNVRYFSRGRHSGSDSGSAPCQKITWLQLTEWHGWAFWEPHRWNFCHSTKHSEWKHINRYSGICYQLLHTYWLQTIEATVLSKRDCCIRECSYCAMHGSKP